MSVTWITQLRNVTGAMAGDAIANTFLTVDFRPTLLVSTLHRFAVSVISNQFYYRPPPVPPERMFVLHFNGTARSFQHWSTAYKLHSLLWMSISPWTPTSSTRFSRRSSITWSLTTSWRPTPDVLGGRYDQRSLGDLAYEVQRDYRNLSIPDAQATSDTFT